MPVSLPLLSVVFFVLDLLCWIGLDRLLRRGGAGRAWRWALAGFMTLQIACLVLVPGSILTHIRPPSFLHVGRLPGCLFFLWHFLILPWASALVAVLTVLDLVRGAPSPAADAKRAPSPVLTRRRFLAMAAPAATATLTTVSLLQLSRFRIRPLTLEITGLPPALDGLRIAHVSDLHVGRLTHGDILDDLVEQTNALKPDLVMVTGDLIDQYLTDLPAALDAVSRFEAKYGTFVCEGNHDLFEGPERFREACRRSPGTATFLFQEASTIQIAGLPVQVLGTAWNGSGDEALQASVQDIAARRDPAAFPILLAHHPHAFDAAEGAGFPLVLAGHTHGGQLMLTDTIGWGPVMFRYWSGIYRKGRSRLVVSNGVGNWFPLRIGAEAEVIDLTLRAI